MGKTTMAKIIAKEIDATSGVYDLGHNVNIAFLHSTMRNICQKN